MTTRELKKGFTTGAAAAASVKGALTYLLSGEKQSAVTIRFLTGETRLISLYRTEKLADNQVECSVIKDAGDDPDVTHKAEIGARVTLLPVRENVRIHITGGEGVGRVTKPGLDVEPGQAAINPGPRTMIKEAAGELLEQFNVPETLGVHVEIFVPDGIVLAEKTLNARLGILGGISILGTTGIVRPMSHDAYIATIRSGISVAAAAGIETLVFTTGRRSERFAMKRFPGFREEAFIQTGDFFRASLDAAGQASGIREVVITVFFGKAVKMAMGFPHTHAARSELTLKTLSEWALAVTADERLAREIAGANTARHAFTFISPAFPGLIHHVGLQVKRWAEVFSRNLQDIRVVIFDFEGTAVFDSRDPGSST